LLPGLVVAIFVICLHYYVSFQLSLCLGTVKSLIFYWVFFTFRFFKKCVWCSKLTLLLGTIVILATQEAEMRKISVCTQLGQILCKTLSRKNPSQKRSGGMAERVGPEFKPQCHKRQNKKTQPTLLCRWKG
jgi:hypothetical protein